MKLSDRALLVQLSISQWTARKFDRKATQEIANSHGVDPNVGRYNKSLLPMNDLLKELHKESAQIRRDFYDNTVPWGIEGTFMLPTGNYLNFMTDFRNKKTVWMSKANLFCQHYPQFKQDAAQVLGSMFDPTQYPDDDEIWGKFNMDIAVMPVPTTDFRTQLCDDELQRVHDEIEQRVTNAAQVGMTDVWERLYTKVKHIADKLSDPKAIFRDTTITNARELCELLPRLNFADDPNLEAMRQEVEQQLLGYHPDSLRNDPILRADKAKQAREITKKMDIFMTGVQ